MEAISQTSRRTLLRLIRKEFDNMDCSMEWIQNTSNELISTARELGLTQLATEMENDKRS